MTATTERPVKGLLGEKLGMTQVWDADDRLVPPGSYEGFHAAAAASGVELTEQVRPHADHASALSAHGVWNQHLLDSMTTFFAEHGADA